MKAFISIFCFAFILNAYSATFELGNKFRPASATVEEKNGCLMISCRFTQLKALRNNPSRSAEYNGRRAKDLCMKALKLYLNVPAGENMEVAGLTTAKQSQNHGGMVEYYFSLPKSGVSMRPAAQDRRIYAPQRPAVPARQTVAASSVPAGTAKTGKSFKNIQTQTSFRMIKYKITDGNVSITSTRNYKVEDFPSRSAFDKFCDQQFQRISDENDKAVAEINRRFQDELRRIKTDFGE